MDKLGSTDQIYQALTLILLTVEALILRYLKKKS